MGIENGLFIADVAHARHAPKKHSLKYKVYYLAMVMQQLKDYANAVFTINGFNLYSFREKDYGFDSNHAEAWAKNVLKKWKVNKANGNIVLVTMPRILGYAFNPVSFWFCLDKNGDLRAVISEVNNTFGDKHCYISFHDDQRVIAKDDWLSSKKVFHVSPFMHVEGTYQFRFAYGEEKLGVWIDYYKDDTLMLTTSMVGKRQELNAASMLGAFVRYPLVTLKVIGMIHWHAIRLKLKGIQYNTRPEPPKKDITR